MTTDKASTDHESTVLGENIVLGEGLLNVSNAERVTKKVMMSSDDIQRMKRLVSLFGDEIGDSPKEIEILSFFFEKSFKAFLDSGIIEKKIASIKGV